VANSCAEILYGKAADVPINSVLFHTTTTTTTTNNNNTAAAFGSPNDTSNVLFIFSVVFVIVVVLVLVLINSPLQVGLIDGRGVCQEP
jgi:hypothetical protein